MQYYSPFDDLFGLAALVKSCANDSLSASPQSDNSYWNEHERERFSDSEGSVFGSDKDPGSPTGYLTSGLIMHVESPTFGRTSSPKEFEFPSALSKIPPAEPRSSHRNRNQRINSVPVSRSQPFMTLTYEDFLKSLECMGPLITPNTTNPDERNASPIVSQPCGTRYDATLLLGARSNSLSLGVPGTSVMEKKVGAARYCVFCKNNGEEEYFYNNHVLKSDNGIIVCPVLRAYQCPICHASGDYAHTIKYCPLGKGNEHDWLNNRGNRSQATRNSSSKV
ncbi:uncharacterized protein LOC134844929 [Symsagittifera roscoffensis]|uniref:uncharacterized protein LOC134844929 n=1 Tax=Symsagittifera roscoffensis TaxID=84072 RepID=UPI00307BFE23